MTPVPGFTRKAIGVRTASNLGPGCQVTSDGLACFTGVTDAGCLHNAMVVGARKPKDPPEFNWWRDPSWNLEPRPGGSEAWNSLSQRIRARGGLPVGNGRR